ncbi:uncharacterized protein LOC123555815 isoform X2 [Mercenaria mercenaria]|uniref:uncharacterized protein LOC123555815 isoform X2 n=1 Tax=Mercenaria mercenaria TaxID=6596 RepID=UPI00234EBD3A|nr:uncharacterized protein LOC123555815 isoform X2 [Mercenaria mercenaria]
MDTEMDEEPQSPEIDPGEPGLNLEPRITNRAQGGVRSDKTRFIRPVERQRMRPWLIDHLDQNDIPGLVWQDQNEKIFRISWKHAANQCFNMQKDTNLFERWAIHTGRHQDSDHKRWKANFRCALNSLPDVTEMKEQGVKKGNNAFKVYRFLDEKEAKIGKDGKTRKKKEPPEYKEESPLVKFREGFVVSCNTGEGTSSGASGATGSSLPDLHQLVPPVSGVDLLLEADSKEKLQPIVGGMDNLQEILAAATASLAAGGDALALEKISIEQLSRLGEVSKMKLDIRQSDRKRRKKEVSGILNVFLCNWCEKVFPTKVDLFQHFLIIHQDKLLSGEEYGARKHTQPTEKLQQEIEDLEKKVLGFTQETYQNESEEVIEDGQVVDLSSNNSMTSQEVYIEDQVLDLSVAGALAKHPQPQSEVALDLSMSTSKHKTGQKTATPKMVHKRRRSNASDVDYANKFGNYGLAGAPRTKRQMSLLLKRKEEEEEKARKHAEAQHSMEDLVHAEILISLKSGSKDENETENMELENGVENVHTAEGDSIVPTETEKEENVENELTKQGGSEVEGEQVKQKMDDQAEEVEEVASLENVVYLELNDGSKVAVSKQIEIPHVETEKEKTADSEVNSKKNVPVLVNSNEKAETVNVTKHDQNGSLGKPYKCALCPQRFEDPTELLTHVSVHKTEYKCSVCTKVMTDKNVYLSHIESHLPDVNHGQICEVCNVHFSTVEELQTHVKSHESGTKMYKCGNCGKTYLTVNECKNCEICHQIKVTDVPSDRKLTSSPLVELKDIDKGSDKTATASTKISETVNEKGAADASVVSENDLDAEKKDELDKKFKNTGQKNLKGEPVVNPATGSDNLTGIENVILRKDDTDLGKQPDVSRKCSTQESFELPVDCLQDTENVVQQRDTRNDVVDGENQGSIHKQQDLLFEKFAENDHERDKIIKEKPKAKEDKIYKQSSSFHRIPKSFSDHVEFTIIRAEPATAAKGLISEVKVNAEIRVSEKHFGKKISQKILKCRQCSETFGNEADLNIHKLSHKETIEDKIRKNVFHCGICDVKLHLNDVEAHLKTHKSCQTGRKIDVKVKDECTCIICNQPVPFNRFYTHLKSHSVYDLSQAQNFMLVEKDLAQKAGTVKGRKPFICNLCGFKFETFSDLKVHVKTHLGPRIVQAEDTKPVIGEQKPAVLAIRKRPSEDTPVVGKKRKDSDEKRITGKRPKKKGKVKLKIAKVKKETVIEKVKTENNTDKSTKSSPVIAAALQSGPKYNISTIATGKSKDSTKEEEAKLGLDEIKEVTDSSIAEVIQLEKATLLVLKSGEVIMRGEEDKEGQKVIKRKRKTQLDSDSQKKLRLVEGLSEHPDLVQDNISDKTIECNIENKMDCSKDDASESHNTAENSRTGVKELKSLDANTSSPVMETLQQMLLLKQGSTGESLEKSLATSLLDTSNLGGNVLPATLHRLQQKILLVKERPVKVTTPVFGPIPVTGVTNQQEVLATNRPVSCPTDCINTISLSEKKNVTKASVISASTHAAETVKETAVKQPVPVNIVKNLCHKIPADPLHQSVLKSKTVNTQAHSKTCVIQHENDNRMLLTPANISVTSSGISLPTVRSVSIKSTSTPSVSTPLLLSSAVPSANILNLSAALAATQVPGAVSHASKLKSSVPVLAGNIQQLQSSVAVVGAPTSSSTAQSICLTVGSLQNQSKVFPGVASNIPVASVDSKNTMIGSAVNMTASTAPNISTNLTLLQQQQQLNMLKVMLGRVNQPSVVYKPALTSVMIPQGGLQQAVPGVARFPSSNIVFAPQPVSASQTTDKSKPSTFQLVWLPVNQAVSSDINKASGSVAPSVTGTTAVSLGDRRLPLQSTVLGAKLGYSVEQTQSQSSSGTLPSIISSSVTMLTTSSVNQNSNPVPMSSHRAFGIPQAIPSSKENDSFVIQVSSVPTAQRSEDSKLVSKVTALSDFKSPTTTSNSSSAAVKSERLCLACAVCKQSLSSLEQMSTHVCNLPADTQTGQKLMSLTRLNKPGTLTDTPPNSFASDRAANAATTTGLVSPDMLHASNCLERISPPQGSSTTKHSTLVSLKMMNTAPSTIPLTTGSSTFVSTAAVTAIPLLSSQGSGTAKPVGELPLPHGDVIRIPGYEIDSSALGKQNVSQKSEIPHTVYFLPTQSTESTAVSTKTTVSSTSSLKEMTTPAADLVTNSAFNFQIDTSAIREESNDLENELSVSSSMNKDISMVPSGEQDKVISISTHGTLPNVILPKISDVGQEVSAQTLTNLYGSKDKLLSDVLTTEVSASSRPIVVKTTEQIITLYPCVICKKTFTFDQFWKHAQKHMTEDDISEKEVSEDKQTPATVHTSKIKANDTDQEGKDIQVEKYSETSRKSDIYRCCLCFTTYDKETSLSQHYETSHPCMADHLCPADNCAQIFFEVQQCHMHYALKHQHECRFCLQRFRTYVEFQAHITQHYENRTLKYLVCVKCKIHFANRRSFYSHCRPSASSKCPGSFMKKLTVCQQCRCCSVNFTSNECMKLHFKRKWYQRVAYRCCICREALSVEAECLSHMTSHFPTSDDNQVCFCHTCCILFPYKTVLTHHMSSSEHVRAETSHQRLLDTYKLRHGGHGNFISSQNIKKTVEEGDQNVQDDIEKHDKNSVITEVETGVIRKDHEKREIRLSQDLHTCSQCNICFKTLFDLKQHNVFRHIRRTPELKKNYYTTKSKVSYHKIIDSKIIVCEFCGKRFFNVSELRQHINISHEEKLFFACKNPDCIMNFNSIYESETHVCESLAKGVDTTENTCMLMDASRPSLKNMKEYMLQYYVEDCKQLLDKVASTIEIVQDHLGDHFVCQYCNKRFRYCQQMKLHLINQHVDRLAQCVDCLEYFFNQKSLLEHRRDCAVKGFSDEDFHTKKKLLGCDVCFNSFIYILGLTKYLRDIKFLSEKNKSSGYRCISRKGVFDLKYDGDSGVEESNSLPFSYSRKFICISCKNEYCNAEDFYICMKSRLTVERNKQNEVSRQTTSQTDETKEDTPGNRDVESMSLFGKSLVDLQNVFFCNECEVFVCYEDGGICAASLKHPCSGNNTII